MTGDFLPPLTSRPWTRRERWPRVGRVARVACRQAAACPPCTVRPSAPGSTDHGSRELWAGDIS